jgi:hypothetical protein
MAYAAKKEGKSLKGKGAPASMAKSMSKEQLKEVASAPQGTAKLPMRVKPKGGGRLVSE